VTYTGFVGDKKVSVVSTGIGGPSAVIALEELTELGAHTFIRVGTCGGINVKVKGGDAVMPPPLSGRRVHSREYAPLEYPAAADFEVTLALKSCRQAEHTKPCGRGTVQGLLYGQHRPEAMPISRELLDKWEAWKRLGVLASEMESSALFVAAAHLGVRCGTVLHAVWNQERAKLGLGNESSHDVDDSIKICIEAIKLL
jgi:uridine phosphorylase